MITQSYVKLGKEFKSNSGKNEKSDVRSREKTYGLGPTKRYTVGRLLEREIAPDDLNGLNEITTSN